MISELGRATVLVTDYDDALDFYTGTLGFEVLADETLDSGFRALHVGPGGVSAAGLWVVEADEDARPLVGEQTGSFPAFVFYTDDVDATYETLRDRGVEFRGEPEAGPAGRHAHFVDPFGNRCVLAARPEHDG